MFAKSRAAHTVSQCLQITSPATFGQIVFCPLKEPLHSNQQSKYITVKNNQPMTVGAPLTVSVTHLYFEDTRRIHAANYGDFKRISAIQFNIKKCTKTLPSFWKAFQISGYNKPNTLKCSKSGDWLCKCNIFQLLPLHVTAQSDSFLLFHCGYLVLLLTGYVKT